VGWVSKAVKTHQTLFYAVSVFGGLLVLAVGL
jgi:hypothetical protein